MNMALPSVHLTEAPGLLRSSEPSAACSCYQTFGYSPTREPAQRRSVRVVRSREAPDSDNALPSGTNLCIGAARRRSSATANERLAHLTGHILDTRARKTTRTFENLKEAKRAV